MFKNLLIFSKKFNILINVCLANIDNDKCSAQNDGTAEMQPNRWSPNGHEFEMGQTKIDEEEPRIIEENLNDWPFK